MSPGFSLCVNIGSDRLQTHGSNMDVGDGKAYEGYGVDKERGALVAVRPDGYVGWVGGLEDIGELERYFGGFLKAQS